MRFGHGLWYLTHPDLDPGHACGSGLPRVAVFGKRASVNDWFSSLIYMCLLHVARYKIREAEKSTGWISFYSLLWKFKSPILYVYKKKPTFRKSLGTKLVPCSLRRGLCWDMIQFLWFALFSSLYFASFIHLQVSTRSSESRALRYSYVCSF